MHPRDRLERMSSVELHALRHTLVRSLGRGRSNDPMCDAEDHVQAALCGLLGRRVDREQPTSLAHFAAGMSRRMHLMSWARRSRRVRIEPAFAQHLAAITGHDEPPHVVIDRRRMQGALARVMAELDLPQRWLVEQRLVEERPFAAILPEWQRRFGGRISTVEGLRTTLFHTRRYLLDRLKES